MKNLNIEITEFSEIVEYIYQSATDVDVWPKVARKICDWLGAKTCVIFTPQYSVDKGGFAIKHQFDGLIELYDTKFNAHNIWEMRAFERGLLTTGSVMRDQELVTDEEFLNSIFYKEYFAPVNIGRMIAGIVFSPPDNDGKAVVCTCHNSFDAPFSETESEKLKLLMPHLSRALGVMFKLRDAEFKVANCIRTLNALSRGVLLFNADGYVCYANDSAKAIFDLKDGLQLKPLEEKASWYLKAINRNTQTLLDAAIFEAISPNFLTTSHFSDSIIVERPSGNAGFALSFSSLGSQHEFITQTSQPCAIAFVYDPSKPIELNNSLLISSYGFTKTELKVADLLVNGYGLEQTSAILEVTINTVKTHLKNIHVKTNVNNRAKLVKLLMTLSGD